MQKCLNLLEDCVNIRKVSFVPKLLLLEGALQRREPQELLKGKLLPKKGSFRIFFFPVDVLDQNFRPAIRATTFSAQLSHK